MSLMKCHYRLDRFLKHPLGWLTVCLLVISLTSISMGANGLHHFHDIHLDHSLDAITPIGDRGLAETASSSTPDINHHGHDLCHTVTLAPIFNVVSIHMDLLSLSPGFGGKGRLPSPPLSLLYRPPIA